MTVGTGFFGRPQGPGKCEVCGSPGGECSASDGPKGPGIEFVDFRHDSQKPKPRFTATRDVVGPDPYGGPHQVLLYARGSEVPLKVAYQEGIVEMSSLTEQDKESLRAHGILLPEEARTVDVDVADPVPPPPPGKKRPGRPRGMNDRATDGNQVVRKG